MLIHQSSAQYVLSETYCNANAAVSSSLTCVMTEYRDKDGHLIITFESHVSSDSVTQTVIA